MGRINWNRVLLGGLLAGLILNVVDFVLNGVILGDRWDAALTALGVPQMGGAAAVWFVITDFLVGIFTIWLYAAIRPRFGPGPKTAAYAGLASWLAFGLIFTLAQSGAGVFPRDLLVVNLLVFLVAAPLVAMAGAWLYQESA